MKTNASDPHPPPTLKRRRWWIGIIFALLGITVVITVALFSSTADPPYAFLKGAHLRWASETIGPAMNGGQIYVRTSDYDTQQSFSKTLATAEAELAKEGYAIAERGKDHVFILQSSSSSYVGIYEYDDSTKILISEMRPPTFLDRSRIWLKSLFPSKAKQREDVGRTK